MHDYIKSFSYKGWTRPLTHKSVPTAAKDVENEASEA